MLIGRYEYSLDAKSRMNFPPKFRNEMGETFYITTWLDGCVAAYSESRWNELNEKLRTQPVIKGRAVFRSIYGNAQDVTLDKQGRILLPQYLKDHAGITKDIVVIGVDDHAEIWDKTKLAEYQSNVDIEAALSELMV